MLDLLRTLRLGGLSVFGVMLPGLLLLGLAGYGIVLPGLLIAAHATNGHLGPFVQVAERHTVLLSTVLLLVGYTLGYVLRLFSPDDLDAESGKHVLKRMAKDEKRLWPYTGCPHDKFPYFCTYQYLLSRGLESAAKYVTWGPDKDCANDPPCPFHSQPSGMDVPPKGKRSKTAINRMKLEIAMISPELAAQAESQEAHIRLMSGAWLAITWTLPLVSAGAIMTLIALSWSCRGVPGFSVTAGTDYGLLLWGQIVLLVSMVWIRWKIRSVFHYRRVGELVYVLQARAACDGSNK